MAKQITQRIALEGGTEFRAGLKSLGAAGQEAFKTIQDAAQGASSIGTRLAPILDQIQKKLKEVQTAAAKVRDNFNETGASIRNTGRNILMLGAAFTGTAVAFALALKNSGEFASNLETTAAALDLTTQQFQELTFAAKLSDVEADQFGRALIALNGKIAEHNKAQLAQGQAQRKLNSDFNAGKVKLEDYTARQIELNNSAQDSTNVFDRLGISLRDGNGELVDGREKLLLVADAFQKADSATQALLLTELGFRRSKGMADFLKQGREGIISLEEEARRIAPPLTQLQVLVGNRLDDAFDKAGKAAESLRRGIELTFAPDVTRLVNAFTSAIADNRHTLLELAASAAQAIRPIINDLVKLLRGQDIDPTSLVAQVRTAVIALAADIRVAISIIIGAWQGFVAVLDQVAAVLNSIFGTNITGQALAFATVIATVTGIFSTLGSIIALAVSVVGLLVAAFGLIPIILTVIGLTIGVIIGQQLPAAVAALANGITSVWTSIVEGIKAAWEGGISFLVEKWNGFVSIILAGINFIKEAMKSIASAFGLGGGDTTQAQGLAGGGMVRGPGTSTSDSILAFLSDREFVINAKAVRKYGAAFFQALNAMRLPVSGFSLGGLAERTDSMLPRRGYATGGLVTAPASAPSGRPVILKIGDQSFGPMIAGEDTVHKLERYAAGQQVRSMGRKPTWKQS